MITQEILKEILEYREDGTFIWRSKISRKCTVGKIAGYNIPPHNYKGIKLFNKQYRLHRLVWLYNYGVFPTMDIDHIDGNPSNNKICNLRCVSMSQNQKNKAMNRNNTSGIMGVRFDSSRNKWFAYIKVNDKLKNLGRYDTVDDAKKARQKAEKEYGFHENHGRKRYPDKFEDIVFRNQEHELSHIKEAK